jgi:flagellin
MHRHLGNQSVAGDWVQNPDSTYRVLPSNVSVDVNLDGLGDLFFEHGYRRPYFYLSQDSANALKTASAGMAEVRSTIHALRSDAIDSANTGVNDEDEFASLQASAAHRLEHIARVARGTMHKVQPLLDGSSGKRAISSEPFFLLPRNVTEDTLEGDYLVEVTQATTRAAITALPQVDPLAQDELLSLNGVIISFFAGMNNTEVIDRINDFSVLTQVRAEQADGATQIYSKQWGSSSEINVISNRPSNNRSTGFGNLALHDTGQDGQISVDGQRIGTHGRVAIVRSGPVRGLTLELGESVTTPTSTVGNSATAVISVVDQSLDFPLLPIESGERIRLSLPNLDPNSLGIGVFNNQFASLGDITIANLSFAQDALAVIDVAYDQVTTLHEDVERTLRQYHLPTGQAFVTSADRFDNTQVAIAIVPLAEGQMVDANTVFSAEPLELDWRELQDSDTQAMFLGFRLIDGVTTRYGWIRFGIDRDNQLLLRDLAYETQSNRGIRIGYVPEPSSHEWIFGLLGFAGRRRLHCVRR